MKKVARVGTLAFKIQAILKTEPRGLFTPKEIAVRLRVSEGAVRKQLCRILEDVGQGPPPLVRVHHGLYRAFTDTGTLPSIEAPEPQLHAVQVSCRMPQNRGWGPPPGAPTSWGSMSSRPAWAQSGETGQWHRDLAFEGRPVTVSVTPSTGTVQVSVRASDDGFDVKEFGAFPIWLKATLQAFGLVWVETEANVDNLEMNEDYRSLFLSVGDRISLRKFVNSWAQVYQKFQHVLRAEIRMTRPQDERLSLAEAVEIIKHLSTKTQPPAPLVAGLPDTWEDVT